MAHLVNKTYLVRLPTTVPPDRVLVHNHIVPSTRRLGSRGFRAWVCSPDPARLEVCDCGWAPDVGRHYGARRRATVDAKRASTNGRLRSVVDASNTERVSAKNTSASFAVARSSPRSSSRAALTIEGGRE